MRTFGPVIVLLKFIFRTVKNMKRKQDSEEDGPPQKRQKEEDEKVQLLINPHKTHSLWFGDGQPVFGWECRAAPCVTCQLDEVILRSTKARLYHSDGSGLVTFSTDLQPVCSSSAMLETICELGKFSPSVANMIVEYCGLEYTLRISEYRRLLNEWFCGPLNQEQLDHAHTMVDSCEHSGPISYTHLLPGCAYTQCVTCLYVQDDCLCFETAD